MFYRENLNTRLSDLQEMFTERTESSSFERVAPEEIQFHLDATDPTIAYNDTEISASTETLGAFGDLLQIPTSFLKRATENLEADTLNHLFSDLLASTVRKDLAFSLDSHGDLIEIDQWGSHESIKPLDVVRKISPVFEEDPWIARLVDEKHHFSFDAYAPFDASGFGVGGDPEVGDLTAAGVRVDINLKQGLVPVIQPFSYRLACTNGMETEMAGLKIEGRGQTIDEVLEEVEGMARLAFAQAEKDIVHFYELREQRVENPERVIVQMGRERGIPQRSLSSILELASGEDMPDDATMFDVVNLVTNFANSPQIRNDGGRRLLERAGGAQVADHAARCGHCTQKVSS